MWRTLNEAKKQGKRILFEGAQGVLLDVDHGTYPFVTSSNTVSGTAASGSGLGPSATGFVLGIVKAYNPYHGWQPVVFQGKAVCIKETLSALSIYNAVAEVEAWITSDGDSLQHPLPMEMAYDLGVSAQMSVFIAKSALAVIPDRIRSYVLNWSLDLESKGILGEGMTFTAQEKSKAPTVITNNFYAPQYQNSGTVGAMGDSAAAGV